MGYSKITALSLTDLFVQQIENMILSGELAIGERLPPARELAVKMGVSRTVVTAGLVELEKLGFVVDKTFADSDDVAADCVMQISPSPGEKLPAGATVYLTISQGAKTETVIMPYLVGKDYATAEAELAAARLTLVSVSYVYNNTIPVDYVVSQTVEAGTEIPAYSKIYLQISLGPETTPTPSPSPVPTQDPNAE